MINKFPVEGSVENKVDYCAKKIQSYLFDCKNPNIVAICGDLGTGKRLIARKMFEVLPESHLLDLGDLTKSCDFFMPNDGWSINKILSSWTEKKTWIITEAQLVAKQPNQEVLSKFIHQGVRIIIFSQFIVPINLSFTDIEWFIISRDDFKAANSDDYEQSPGMANLI